MPSIPRSELLDSLEKGFREVSTVGLMLHQTVAERPGAVVIPNGEREAKLVHEDTSMRGR